MPLEHLFEAAPETRIGLWRVTESPEELKSRLQWGENDLAQFEKIKDAERAMHWLASRVLLREMLGTDQFIDLWADEYGKPHLRGLPWQLSLSHSGEWVAVILSPFAVGIDIQRISAKIEAIAHKFVSERESMYLEEPHRSKQIHVIWGVKEALYKLYGKKKVDFREHLKLHSFIWAEEGSFRATICKEDFQKEIPVWFRQMGDYVLAYAVDKD